MLSDEHRSSLVTQLRRTREPSASIPRRDPGLTELPLSFGQEQLWFIDQFTSGPAAYNIAVALELAGPLDLTALTTAVNALATRHEVLRTRFTSVQGTPAQVVDPPAARNLTVVDLSERGPARRESELHEIAQQHAVLPFPLEGHLFRTKLVKLGDREHVLLVCLHHAVSDGWSFEVLGRELAALYQEAAAGVPADLPELPIQFADYALWERERLQGETLEKLTTYWRRALAGVQPLQLPVDKPRPPVQSFEGSVEQAAVGAEVLEGLRALSRQEGTTMFVTLLAALQVLLHRYSGQDDLVVGTVSANRSRPELAPLIGYFVNTLPIRADLSDNPAFVDHLRRAKAAVLDAYAHQELPFAKLVDALNLPRDASRPPLFQVGFSIDEAPPAEPVAGELTFRPTVVEAPVAKFDLEVSVQAWGELVVAVSYATSLFEPATVRRILASLRVLMTAIVRDPTRRVAELPVMSDEDVRRELVEWNATAVEYPQTCLHEMFERRAREHPDAQAVAFGGESLTYAELNHRAEQAAHHLRGLGVGPERLVGIHMRPSTGRLASILGVLKAGGAYVPLDPEYPAERLSFMVGDTGAVVVLVDDTDHAAAVADAGANVVAAHRVLRAAPTGPGERLTAGVSPANAAYVIYTSGSTGRPKGVVVEHRQVANFVHGMVQKLALGTEDRILQFASLNFDVSVMDMFLALCSGGTAVFGAGETLLSPTRLAQLMREQRVTYACLPPAMLDVLSREELPDQRIVISAGEALAPQLAHKWLRPGLRLYNGYGLTETAIGGTLMELRADDVDQPPIGMPIPNYRAYVLDARLNLVPTGVVGELYVGGASVTRGYLHRPQLTSERFIPDPFGGEPGARMYRSGDLARRRADGSLIYLGRMDGQVKIHGLRIELGEIEATLASHTAVAQAVAVVREGSVGDKQLVGYARLEPHGPGAGTADLHQYLAQRLPGYMVPKQIMLVDTFPLNASGKIDRAALPSPELTDGQPGWVPPRTVLEAVLVDTFARLLGLTQVSVEDSFFDVGGNSLQAMRLVSELNGALAVDADVTAVFLAPTPRRLAALVCERYGVTDSELADALPAAEQG